MRMSLAAGLVVLAGCGSPTKPGVGPGSGSSTTAPCDAAPLLAVKQLQDQGHLRAAWTAAQALDPACVPEAAELIAALGNALDLDVSLEPPAAADQAEARRLHAEGIESLAAGFWDDAVTQLEAAHGKWPHPRILAALSRAHAAAGRAAEARIAAERALSLAERMGGGPGVPRMITGHSDTVYALAYHGRGRWLASAEGQDIVVWDLATDQPAQRFVDPASAIVDVAFLPDGTLLSASVDGTLRVWDIHRGDLVRAVDAGDLVRSMSLHPDGSRLALLLGDAEAAADEEGTEQTQLNVYDLARDTVLWSKVTHDWQVRWTPDGQRLISVGVKLGKTPARCEADETCLPAETSRVALWQPDDGKLLLDLTQPPEAEVDDAAVSFDGATLAIADGNNVHLWKLGKKPKKTRSFEPQYGAGEVDFLADGTILVDGRLHDATGKKLRDVAVASYAGDIAVRADGAEIAMAPLNPVLSYERRIVIGNVATGEQRSLGHTDQGETGRGFAFSPSGERLVVADGLQAAVFELAGNAPPIFLDGGGTWIGAAVFSPDEESLALAGGKRVAVVSRADGAELHRIDLQRWTVAVGFRPDGNALAYGDDSAVEILDLTTGASLHRLSGGHAIELLSIDWSADGKRLLSVGRDHTTNLWDVAAGKVLTKRGAGRAGFCGAIRPDGDAFATTGRDMEKAIEVVSADGVVELQAPIGQANSVAWSPDGTTLAASLVHYGEQLGVHVWRPGDAEATVLPWDTHIDEVEFHPGGRTLAAMAGRRELTFWDLERRAVVAHLAVGDGGRWAVVLADGHVDGSVGLPGIELVFGDALTLPASLDPTLRKEGALAQALGN